MINFASPNLFKPALMKNTIVVAVLLLAGLPLLSQEYASGVDTIRKDALKVFMDSDDYIRKEITFINYVRDIKDADVYIISSTRRTGSGGREKTYFLIGQKAFSGMTDTLIVMTNPDDTDDIKRYKEASVLKMGLLRYVLKTPLAPFVRVSFMMPVTETIAGDKWNSWVYSLSIGGFLQGQKSSKSSDIYSGISANRVTEKMKTEINLSYDRGEDEFNLGEFVVKSINQSKSIKLLNVWAINKHWSYGGSMSVSSSTFNNLDLQLSFLPGIEYNIFPYDESTRRQLRLMYRAGYEYQNYTDSTIYDKLKEGLPVQLMSAAYEVVQKWGSVSLDIEWRNYLHDFSKNSLGISGYLNFRIAKGLSVNFGGSYKFVHDQMSLVKGGASPEEILLRRKELQTQYSYFTNFGISYTFGSIYNNVVNPRFGSGGRGGGSFMFGFF